MILKPSGTAIIKIISTTLFVLLLTALTKIPVKVNTEKDKGILDHKSFIDNSGNYFQFSNGVNTIISLSPVHTENLFHIGAGEQIVGTDRFSIFPYEAVNLEKFYLNRVYDLNRIIEINPDVVLVEPEITKTHRQFIAKLESNGIKVVSLMPEALNDFESYIRKLAIICGKQKEGKERLITFYSELNSLKNNNNRSKSKKMGIYVEVSEKGYITVTKESLIGDIVELAGCKLITPETSWFNMATERIQVNKSFIFDEAFDYYLTVKGSGYSGASKESITQRVGFKDLEVIFNGNLYEISGRVLGNYTFRLIDGIKELQRLTTVKVQEYELEAEKWVTRSDFALFLYHNFKLQTYFLTNPGYYNNKKENHTYGSFVDVKFSDLDFNIIETVSMKAYILPKKGAKDSEYFNRGELITRDDLEHFLFIYKGINRAESNRLFNELGLNVSETYTGADITKLFNIIWRHK